jgi:hypothetical protein
MVADERLTSRRMYATYLLPQSTVPDEGLSHFLIITPILPHMLSKAAQISSIAPGKWNCIRKILAWGRLSVGGKESKEAESNL